MESKIRILVLDDEPIVGERLKASLEHAGYVVDAYVSSQDALDRLRVEQYEVLITDLKMKSPDGIEVLREVRRINPDIKSIVITGFATTHTAEEALGSGAVMFIPKPFKMKELKSMLLDLIKRDEDPDE